MSHHRMLEISIRLSQHAFVHPMRQQKLTHELAASKDITHIHFQLL